MHEMRCTVCLTVLFYGVISYLCFCSRKSERVVRIGVPDDTYDKINGNGKRSGYGYEYLQKMARRLWILFPNTFQADLILFLWTS